MKKKKCPKCKHEKIETINVTTDLTDYGYSEGLLSDAPPHVQIQYTATAYQCMKCGHIWKAQAHITFRINVERIEPGDSVT